MMLDLHKVKTIQYEKMASLGEMSVNITHELANLTATIQGRIEYLELLLERGKIDPQSTLKAAHTIKRVTDRMNCIIRGIQSFARDGSKDPFQLKQVARVVEDVVTLCKDHLASFGIKVIMGDIDESIVIPCRESQISQILLNLINNAKDAVQDRDERWIKVDLVDRENVIELSVTDSGPGIPEELQQKIMQPFFTTKEVGKGTGLGLSISKSIVENHKGSLRIDTRSPNTRFVVSLPKKQVNVA